MINDYSSFIEVVDSSTMETLLDHLEDHFL